MKALRLPHESTARTSGQFSLRDTAVIGIVLALLMVGLMASGLPRRLNAAIYDLTAGATQPAPSKQILIVTIDDKSLQAIGRWPWSRRIHAAFLDRLAAAGDTTVGLDLLLADRDPEPAADDALADSIRNHGRVILPVVPASLVDASGLTTATSLPPIVRYATLAHADVDTDPDGVVRRMYLRAGLGMPTLPTLGLALIQARAGIAGNDANASPTPADARAWTRSDEVMIPFAGPAGSYSRVSYVDVLDGRVASDQLRGKYILVGASAAGLGTRFATPTTLASRLPLIGAELHANLLDALLAGRTITALQPPWALTMMLAWLAAGLVLLRCQRAYQVVVGTAALLVLLGLSTWLGVRHASVWPAPAPALIALLAIYPIWSWRQLRWHMGALFHERGQSHATLELVHDGIITLDGAGRARYLNSAAETITGRPLAQVLGRPLDEITGLKPVDSGNASPHSDDADLMRIATHTLTAPDGSERAVRIARHPLPLDGGSVVAITDVTANLTLAREIRFQATHDSLTGLPNRGILADRLRQTLAAARRRNQPVGVLFIDLDGFKRVNDALGHNAGDRLLREVGVRLGSRIRGEDTAARWGGDEFVLVLSRLDDEQSAIGIADAMVALLEEPFDLDGQPAFISASVGISLFPRDGEDGEQLLLRADTAMYRAKKNGGRGVSVFSHEVGAWNKARLNLENELRTSLQRGPLDVFYQPIIDLRQGCVTHVEALVRWQHPAHGTQTPAQFLTLAESSGLIHEIGAATLYKACADAQQLARQGVTVGVSVNVSPQQLTRGELPARVGEALATSGLPAGLLTLEVTENGIVSDAARAADTISALRQMGVSIALDDFGTGYSSLSLLRDFPIDILKIDRSFVPNPQHRAGDLTIAHAIIGMGRNLDKTVIAEGVETSWQSRALLVGGCHLQQGFLHSPPVTVDEIPRIARRVALAGAPSFISSH
jgi:diguanylate cyclase (GGDEF)-like protein/PAS domain S-box-containing protein